MLYRFFLLFYYFQMFSCPLISGAPLIGLLFFFLYFSPLWVNSFPQRFLVSFPLYKRCTSFFFFFLNLLIFFQLWMLFNSVFHLVFFYPCSVVILAVSFLISIFFLYECIFFSYIYYPDTFPMMNTALFISFGNLFAVRTFNYYFICFLPHIFPFCECTTFHFLIHLLFTTKFQSLRLLHWKGFYAPRENFNYLLVLFVFLFSLNTIKRFVGAQWGYN